MVRLYRSSDCSQVIDLVLRIQNDEYHVGLSLSDQPDLTHINESYFDSGGAFWVAQENDSIIGCIGFLPLSSEVGVLKKFFVDENFRGKGVSTSLYKSFITFAKEKGFTTVILDTPSVAKRSHAFYKHVGFQQVSKEDIPVIYEYTDRNSLFFILSPS